MSSSLVHCVARGEKLTKFQIKNSVLVPSSGTEVKLNVSAQLHTFLYSTTLKSFLSPYQIQNSLAYAFVKGDMQ